MSRQLGMTAGAVAAPGDAPIVKSPVSAGTAHFLHCCTELRLRSVLADSSAQLRAEVVSRVAPAKDTRGGSHRSQVSAQKRTHTNMGSFGFGLKVCYLSLGLFLWFRLNGAHPWPKRPLVRR